VKKATKQKTGRKPLHPSGNRRCAVRLPTLEADEYVRLASELGLSFSQYLRLRLMGGPANPLRK